MEELRSIRHWGKKPHGSAVFARSAYDDLFSRMPFPEQFEDYCEIFGTAASASSIPVLDLPPPDDDFVAAGDSDRPVSVDYSEIFGGLSRVGFMVSYEELFGGLKRSGVSSLDGVAGWGALSQQANEASELLVEGYYKDHFENLEMEEVISVPNNTDDTSSKKFSTSYHKTSWENVDDLVSDKTNMAKLDAINEFNFVVDASDPVIKTENNKLTQRSPPLHVIRQLYDERQDNEASFNSFSNAANSESLKVDQTSSRSNCDSRLDTPQNENYLSRSSSYHSASSGDISFSDVEYFNISEISLQTKSLQGPPPSTSPPQVIKKPDNPKMVHTDSNSDVEDGSLQIPKLKHHMQSNNGVTKIQAIDEKVEVNSCSYGNEIDPSSAAAASVAAVKAAMEQAQARLKIAKELMDRKQDKYKRKVDQPKAMNCGEDEAHYEVALKSCSKVMAATKLLKGNHSINERAFPERQEISNARMTTLNLEKKGRLPSSGESQRLMSSDNGFKSSEATCEFDDLSGEWKTEKKYNEVIRNDGLFYEVNDNFMQKKAKAVYACQDIFIDAIKEEQAFEVLENQKSSEATCSIEKLESDHNLNGASMAYMNYSKKNVVNSSMEDFMITESASKLNEACGCCLLDDTEKRCDAHEDNTAENDGNTTNECDGYKDNTTKDDDDSPKSFVGSCLCKDSENIIVSEGLCSSKTIDKMELVEETNKFKEDIGQTECMNVPLCKVEENNNSAEEDDPNRLQENEEVHIFVKKELEQEAIHNANGLENGKEIRDASAELHEDKLIGSDRNHELHNFVFLAAAERDCAEKESDNTLEVPMARNFGKNHFISASAKEVWQRCEESDAPEIILSGKEDNSPAKAPDMTEVFNAEVAENHKHLILTEEVENKRVLIEKLRDKERAIRLEAREREREREKDKIAVERANHDAHQRALFEARERAERIAVERVTAEARQRALADAREKAEKAAEAEKAYRGARLRAERAAVERATEEARQRAIEKALAEKATIEARSRMRKGNETVSKDAYVKEDSETRLKSTSEILLNTQSQSSAYSNNGQRSSNSCDNGGSESNLRCKARQERQQRTAERAANALAEKNMRDVLAQREQAERDRLAESLDAEVRRWSTGKDGNLRALLSTLQYILGSDSSWQPVSLTDVLTAAAVKKAYRKATLCVHPDKLQQRSATIQQKYICEKVFDLLKDAWNKFNSEER